MALNHITYFAMPHLTSYEEASEWEANVKPIKGDAEGRKPLGRRNQKWRRIKREGDGSIIIFEDWRGNSDWYIRFTPDNELHIYDVCWWNKASHNEVIQRVTGLHLFTEARRMWARYDGGTVPISARVRPRWMWDAKVGKGTHVKNGEDPEPSVFVRNERGYWVCKNPERITAHRVNRKGAKAVRQRYAAGINYIKVMASLHKDEKPMHEELVAAFRDTLLKDLSDIELKYSSTLYNALPYPTDHRFTHTHAAKLAALIGSDDPGDQYKAFLWLMRNNEHYDTYLTTNNIDRVLTMHHHDEWLEKVEHKPGSKAIDRYKWAVPQAQTA